MYCINDKKEKALIDKYNLITKHNSSQDKKGKNNIDNSINLFVIEDNDDHHFCFDYPPNIFFPFSSSLEDISIDHLSPPPRA